MKGDVLENPISTFRDTLNPPPPHFTRPDKALPRVCRFGTRQLKKKEPTAYDLSESEECVMSTLNNEGKFPLQNPLDIVQTAQEKEVIVEPLHGSTAGQPNLSGEFLGVEKNAKKN